MKVDRVRINFWVPKKTYNFLTHVASMEGRSMSDILRESLRDFQSNYRDIEETEGGDEDGRDISGIRVMAESDPTS